MIGTQKEIRQRMTTEDSWLSVLRKGRGETVLLAHSFLWNAEMWRPQIDALARRYAVLAPDLWGHGDSGPVPSTVGSIRDIAVRHLDLLDQLKVDQVTIVGVSIGGMWGAELALMAPDRVKGLVLMNTFLGSEFPGHRSQYTALLNAAVWSGSVTDDLADIVAPLFFSHAVSGRQPQLLAGFRENLRRLDASAIRDSLGPLGRMMFDRRAVLHELHRLPMRRLVISGADDASRPAHEGRLMSEILASPYIELKDAGLIASLETPNEVTDALLDFLEPDFQPPDPSIFFL